MEHQPIKRKLKKADFLLCLVLVAIGVLCLVWYRYQYQEQGNQVEITVDGKRYGIYELKEEQEIPVEIDGVVTNILLIEEGKADMISAECPDQLCVHQKAISSVGETIVCLPNRVVATVTGQKEANLDSIAK